MLLLGYFRWEIIFSIGTAKVKVKSNNYDIVLSEWSSFCRNSIRPLSVGRRIVNTEYLLL